MVPWKAVKEPLRLPFVFLLVVLCATAVLAALQVFAGGGPLTLELAAARLPRAAFEVMLPAVLLSIVLLGFRMARRPISRFLAFLIVLGAGYVVLVNGLIWTHRAEAAVQARRHGARRRALPADEVIHRPRHPSRRAGSPRRAIGSGRCWCSTPPRRCRDSPSTARAPCPVQGDTVSLQLAGAKPLALRADLAPAEVPLFAADRFTELFLRDFRTMNDDLRVLLERAPGRFFVACFAMLFLVTALLVLLRATRWPLFNVLLLVLAVRACLLLYHVLAVDLAPTVARVIADPLLALPRALGRVPRPRRARPARRHPVRTTPTGGRRRPAGEPLGARPHRPRAVRLLPCSRTPRSSRGGWSGSPTRPGSRSIPPRWPPRQALLDLLTWIVPVTAGAVVTALSLAAGSAKRGGPALPFNQLVASAVVTFLVLAAGFTALSETAGAGSSRRLDELAWHSRLAREYERLALKARDGQDWKRAAEYDRLYLQIDPENAVVEEQRTTDEANAARAAADARPVAAPTAKSPEGVDAGSLVRKAQAYFDDEDWFSALWYARQAGTIDPRSARTRRGSPPARSRRSSKALRPQRRPRTARSRRPRRRPSTC